MEKVGSKAFEGSLAPDRTPQATDVQKVGIGNVVPDFACHDEEGKEHRLSDHRGTKVMLCFYRHSHCPAVANSIGKLAGNYKKLAWASKLKVITVFRTNQEYLKEGLTDTEGPIVHFIRKDSGSSDAFIRENSRPGTISYPFLALADPDGTAASAFKVGSKSKFLFLLDVPTYSRAVLSKAMMKGVMKKSNEEAEQTPGASTLLPSEFLIDERGILVDVMRSKKASDTMAVDRISNFLFGGETEKRSANLRQTI